MKHNAKNPVVRLALAVESAFERAMKAHRRALVADLKRQQKGRDGWTEFQVNQWLVREIRTCAGHSGAPLDSNHGIEMRIRARVAIELLAEREDV